MQFQYPSEPVEGVFFRVSLIDARGPVNIRFYVDGELINVITCPDPPCHEMIMMPVASAGQILRMLAIDANGQKAEKILKIQSRSLPPSVTTQGGPVGPVNPVTDPVKTS